MKDVIAQQLAYILVESIDDKRYWAAVAEHQDDLAPKRVPMAILEQHVTETVNEALRLLAQDTGVRDILHDAMMKALEAWYDPHEW